MKFSLKNRFLFLSLQGSLLLLALSTSKGALINGSFESGTTGWTETGGVGNFTAATSINGLYQSLAPNSGTSFGVISNNGVSVEGISQSFVVSASPSFLSIRFAFLTDSYNDTFANDTATAILTPTAGAPITLFTVSRDTLQAGGDGPLLAGAQYFDTQTISQNAWQLSTTNISAYAGQTVTLSFSVNNGGDPDNIFESRLALDGISNTAVPEPSLNLGFILTTGALLLRRKKKQGGSSSVSA